MYLIEKVFIESAPQVHSMHFLERKKIPRDDRKREKIEFDCGAIIIAFFCVTFTRHHEVRECN